MPNSAMYKKRIASEKLMNKDVCKWEFTDYVGWKTFCNNIFVLDEDTDLKQYKYCPGCGKPIEEVKEDE